MASMYGPMGVPNIVLVGVPHLKSLQRVAEKLRANAVPHYEWTEPDYDLGFTSITTAPVRGEQRKVFENYRVYSAPGVLMASTRASKARSDGSIPSGCANGDGTEASVRV